MSLYSNLKGASILVYSSLSSLPLVNVAEDTIARTLDTDKLYIWNGTGWYYLPPTNENPTITTGGDATYALAADGSATVVTLEANDPEGFDIVWSYAVTTGSLGSTATVTQADNVFTITPSIDSADAGGFTLTFTASDGVNIATSASEFSLVFLVPGRAIFYNDAAQADQVQTGSGDNPEWYFGKATRHIWTVPSGVTSVHAICVGAGGGSTNAGGGGGGGLTWANDIPVTPGAQYEVLVGSPGGTHYGNPNYIGGSSELSLVGGANVLFAGGGGTASAGAPWPRNNGGLGGTGSSAAGLTAGGGSGGNGGGANGSDPGMGTDGMFGGGGGAGGYTATGGAGGDFWDSNPSGTAGTGGGGGGGAAGNSSGSGGGVGIYGQGDNGTAGTHPGSGTVWGTPGGGGSGGADGAGSNSTAQGFGGGNYGGGAGYSNRPGGNGIVTIIWGLNRAYPNTNVDLAGDN